MGEESATETTMWKEHQQKKDKQMIWIGVARI